METVQDIKRYWRDNQLPLSIVLSFVLQVIHDSSTDHLFPHVKNKGASWSAKRHLLQIKYIYSLGDWF